MNQKWIYILGGIAVLILLTYWTGTEPAKGADITVPVREGVFEVLVVSTGELEAKNSVKINAPDALRTAGIYQVKVIDLVSEGTVVKKGDYVASLDKSELADKLRETELEIQKIKNLFNQSRLDTSLTLRTARDEMVNLSYTVKEKELFLKGMTYEAKADIKKAEIDLEKAKRTFEQARENYFIKKDQATTKVYEVNALLQEQERKKAQIESLMENFSIYAPEDGMVIYRREWDGKKKTIGGAVSAWDPVVATLPDMSEMVSRTYVNEVDISKVSVGQKVLVGVDAFPNKQIEGKVIQVANVGEVLPGTETKVFEVLVLLIQKDPQLRPTMTTSNQIICSQTPNALIVPLECVHSMGDSLNYVYMKRDRSVYRQEVRIGATNASEAIVMKGVKPGEKVYLSIPEEAESLDLQRLKKDVTFNTAHP